MRKELEDLGFVLDSSGKLMYYKSGDDSIAVMYVGGGNYNISSYLSSTWGWKGGCPKQGVVSYITSILSKN